MNTPSANGPLAGLKVVELHAIGPVPYAGQVLRSLGATVLRISPPDDPGLGVNVPPEYDLLNAGKTSKHLDLKQGEGVQALHRELDDADVLLEGFRPGVLERLALRPQGLLAAHPRLVIGRLSGWGRRGALAARAGHDINYLALAGVLNAIGTREAPAVPLNLVADFGGGAMHLLVGVLARLVQRSITQRGGIVETSILAGTVGLTPMFYGLMGAGIWNLQRAHNLLDGAVPFYRVYRCADERFVAVGALEPKFYAQLLDVTGLASELRVADQYRADAWPDAAQRFARRFASRTRDEWAQAALDRDACLTPVLDFAEAARDAHNLENELFRNDPFAQPDRIIEFDRLR